MSRSRKAASGQRGRRRRQVSVRAVRRETPDLRRLSRAIVSMALAESEASAQSEPRQKQPASAPSGGPPPEITGSPDAKVGS